MKEQSRCSDLKLEKDTLVLGLNCSRVLLNQVKVPVESQRPRSCSREAEPTEGPTEQADLPRLRGLGWICPQSQLLEMDAELLLGIIGALG